LKTVVFAYHNMGLAGLEALARHGYDIAAVFTHEDDPGENCWFGSVQDWARKRSISTYTPENVNLPKWVEKISALHPDMIFSFYYRKMLANEIIAIPKMGAFNLHGSLLPLYRGRCPVNWVLVFGEQKTGVTLHYMIDKPDAGDIVGQKEVAIDFADTARTLYDKLCSLAGLLLDELLPSMGNGQIPRRPQNLAAGSYYGGRKPEDGRIDWSKTATEIYNLIRAVTEPYPGAFAFADGDEKIIIWWAEPSAEGWGEKPGTVKIRPEEVLVQTGKDAVKILSMEAQGKRFVGTDIINYFRGEKVKKLK